MTDQTEHQGRCYFVGPNGATPHHPMDQIEKIAVNTVSHIFRDMHGLTRLKLRSECFFCDKPYEAKAGQSFELLVNVHVEDHDVEVLGGLCARCVSLPFDEKVAMLSKKACDKPQ